MNEQLREVLSELFWYHEFGDEAEGVEVAEQALRDLVSETISKPIYAAAQRAAEAWQAGVSNTAYQGGRGNALYWALNKIDDLFGED